MLIAELLACNFCVNVKQACKIERIVFVAENRLRSDLNV